MPPEKYEDILLINSGKPLLWIQRLYEPNMVLWNKEAPV